MWKQGEHVAVVGQTGSGKTFLEAELVKYRRSVIVIRTKSDDIKFDGFERIRTIDQINTVDDKYVLEPRYEKQGREAARALDYVWKAGGWCICVDELYYATLLKLEPFVNRLLTQGRSKGISVLVGMQRPSRISRFALSETKHNFFFTAEGRDIKLLGEATSPAIEKPLAGLKRYEFVYYNRAQRTVQVGKAQQLQELLGGQKQQ